MQDNSTVQPTQNIHPGWMCLLKGTQEVKKNKQQTLTNLYQLTGVNIYIFATTKCEKVIATSIMSIL